jgi:RNA polymerase sigma-70 factor (ECF subfamily)
MDESAADTETLLRRAGGGEPEAVRLLFARHRAYLLRVVDLRLDGRVRARVDPSDVVQDALLEAVRRLPDYLLRRPMGFRLWLRKTAHERLLMAERLHLDSARRSVRREVPLPEGSSAGPAGPARPLAAGGPSPPQQLDRRDGARRVREAVARLAPQDRAVLTLRTFEGLSNQQVAEVLGIAPAAASRRYGRAVLRLRAELARGDRPEDRS